ncbi:hypothetical protein QE152_g4202 [Popillia japonica]|uniref:Peptidase A2 domain-containing protein n=1 Tax=Popillia japonica TaxID=7064 RepID=A0AAW1N187_POPJA
MLQLEINQRKCEMELDTGAAVSTISATHFKKLCSQTRLESTTTKLRTYTGEIIHPLGVATVQINYKGQSAMGKIYVLPNNVDAIFGREWLRLINLDWKNIRQLRSDYTANNFQDGLQILLEEFKDLFEGLGEIRDYSYRFHLKDDNAKPIFIKPRQVPYAQKKKIEDEITRLEQLGIIEPIVQSPWATPVVPVVKKDGNHPIVCRI